MSKKLLVLNDPAISTYTSYGTLFSIMDDKLMPWVFNNFIQVRFAMGWGMLAFDQHHILLKSCPGVSFHSMPYELITLKWKNLKEVIIDAIDSGYYLYVFLDRYYLPITHSYQQKHKKHEILIYGYDLANNNVYVADNLKSSKFISDTCSFNDVENAFPNKDDSYDFETEIRFIKVKKDSDYECNINPEQIRLNLEHYLYSTRTFDLNHEQAFIYGFEAIEKMFTLVEEGMKNGLPLDLRGFHLLYEHKVLMDDRLKYLMLNEIIPEEKDLTDAITKLKQNYLTLRNLVIKFNIAKSEELLVKIGVKLRSNVEEEKIFIAELIKRLKKYEKTMTPIKFYF